MNPATRYGQLTAGSPVWHFVRGELLSHSGWATYCNRMVPVDCAEAITTDRPRVLCAPCIARAARGILH